MTALSEDAKKLREEVGEALWRMPTAGMALTWDDEDHDMREYFRKCADAALAALGLTWAQAARLKKSAQNADYWDHMRMEAAT